MGILFSKPSSPLMQALQKGDEAEANKILFPEKTQNDHQHLLTPDNPINLQERDGDGNTLLHWAVFQSYPEVAEGLIKRGIDVTATNNEGATAHAYATIPSEMSLLLTKNWTAKTSKPPEKERTTFRRV